MADVGESVGRMDATWISEQLAEFTYVFDQDDSDFVNKMNILSETYNLSGDDLISDLIAFTTNQKRTNLDLPFLELYEHTVLVKKADQSMNEASHSVPQSSRTILGERKVAFEREDSPELDASSFVKEIEAESTLGEKYMKFTPDRNASSSVVYQNRKNRGKILANHCGKFYARESRKRNDAKVHVELCLRDSIFASLARYGNEKDMDKIEEICSRVDLLTEAIREGNKSISGFEPLDTISTEPFVVCGQVFDDSGEQLHATSCSLQATDENATTISLDLSKLPSYSLFPGKVVAMRGTNETGSLFAPTEMYEPPVLPAPTVVPQREIDSLSVWCAAGPFTSTETFSFEQLYDFLELAVKESPDVLILMGPFIDRTSKAAQSPSLSRTFNEIFEALLANISQVLKGKHMRLILVPSRKDATVLPFHPTAAYEVSRDCKKCLLEEITFATDPAIIRIAGLELAVSNSEVLQHLGREEIHCSENSENEDRVARLISHLIRQRSLYPLHPPPSGFSQCVPKVIKASALSAVPNVMILSSMLAPMTKIVDGCLCANANSLARGSYLKLDVDMKALADDKQCNPHDCCSLKIVRL